MQIRRLSFLVFCFVNGSAWAQTAPWVQDTAWVSQGWAHANLAGWEDLRGLSPWGENAIAGAVQVYAEEGGSHPVIVRLNEDADLHVLFPFEQDLERPTQIQALATDESDRLWCALNQRSHDSSLTSIGGIMVLDSEGAPDSSFGSDTLPGWLSIYYGSPFQELHGLDKSDGTWLASGMVLDPCCFHREMPTLALLDSAGQWVESFGTNGRVVVDVGAAEIVDTLGLRPAFNRHEIGGFYAATAATEGGWIAAGAYSNAAHYEVLVSKHDVNGSLDPSFGEMGIVHLNLNPGVNHWAQDLRIENDGIISLNVVSHGGGDLPTGWHGLTLDATGTPLQWETAETAAPWTSCGFLNTPGPWPMGVGFVEGAVAPSLVSYSEELNEAPPILSLEPLLIPEGEWAGFQCVYHPDWSGLIVAGRFEELSNDGEVDSQIQLSLWQEVATHISLESPDQVATGQLYPNPVLAGNFLHLDQVATEYAPSETWVLWDINGRQLTHWPASLQSLQIDTDIPSGIYILEAPSPSMERFRLIIE
tara:strand:+ start:4215 stop:5810 length:1596 start_codon:yes stop_codon:yes gene_type:complete